MNLDSAQLIRHAFDAAGWQDVKHDCNDPGNWYVLATNPRSRTRFKFDLVDVAEAYVGAVEGAQRGDISFWYRYIETVED